MATDDATRAITANARYRGCTCDCEVVFTEIQCTDGEGTYQAVEVLHANTCWLLQSLRAHLS